ncbi:MAG: hypothetical protein JWL77_5821 [Chthonomonadaceae bacterium]|nr:hypothetical protein [Chthonomonadaceae bacterium]
MASGRSNNLMRQVGEHLVCAELGRRGFTATPFSGNVPTFDVLATDDQCRTVPIQVKASIQVKGPSSSNWRADARHWMNLQFDPQTGIQHYKGPSDIDNPDLIFVCVSVAPADSENGKDRFFILTKSDLQLACIQHYEGWMIPHGWKRPKKPECYECRYGIKEIGIHEDKWHLIQERLDASSSSLALPAP